MLFKMLFERGGGATSDIDSCFARAGLTGIRVGQDGRRADQWGVGRLEQGNIGDAERTHGFTVVAAFQAEEVAFLRVTPVAPAVEGHFQRDFSR